MKKWLKCIKENEVKKKKKKKKRKHKSIDLKRIKKNAKETLKALTKNNN